MIVVIIIGVLVALAISQFQGPKEQALEREAKANLKLIAAAEKIYRMEIGKYMNASSATAINTDLSLMLPTQNPKWNYKVVGATTSAFTAKAQRTSATATSLCISESVEEPYSSGCTY